MPIYEYKCNKCNHQLEILQKINGEPAKTCPECNTDNLRKLVSAASFKLKGTGWYETDFKTKESKKDGDATKKNNSNKTIEEKAGKSETKPKDSSNKNGKLIKTSTKKSSS
tara:strand:+ start:777 stop:1109 length:333 start_codon:yes stop_codon:yes gene_type:complete